MKTSHFFPIALVTALFLPGMTKGLCPSITIDIPDIPSGCVGETVIVSPRLEEIAGNCNHMTTYPYKRWNWVVIGDNIVEPMAGNNIPASFVTVRGGHGKIIFNLICRSRACPDCNRNFEVEKEFDVVHVAIEQGSLMVCGKDDWAYWNVTDDTHAPDGVVWTSRPHGIHGHGSSVSFRPSQLVPGAYTVKAANDGTPSCPDVCEVHVIKVNIPTTNIFVCAEDSLASLSLSGDSYSPGSYVWSSTPDGISGCGPDQTITFVPSNLPPGKYVVQCQSADLEDCLDECEVNILSVDFVKLSETENKANQIFNPTRKDDPTYSNPNPDPNGDMYGVPRNYIYMVPNPADGTYNVTIKADIQPADLRTRFYAAGYLGNQIVSGSGKIPFDANGECNLNFLHPGSSPSVEDFTIKVGFDQNDNGELDSGDLFMPCVVKNTTTDEVIGAPMVRGSSGSRYTSAKESVDDIVDGDWTSPGWATSLVLPHAKRLLQIFRDGNASGVPTDKQPTSSSNVSFNAFTGYFAEWLTHNSGASFDDSGNATLTEYYWDEFTSLADLVATSPQIEDPISAFYNATVYSIVTNYFAGLPVGTVATFPSPNPEDGYSVTHTSESPSWVPPYTKTFDTWRPNLIDDVNGTIGRGRLLFHKVRYKVEKRETLFGSKLVVTEVRSWGEVSDLYDFNHDVGGAAQNAAILQIGYGNGSYGTPRNRGKVFRDRIEFNKLYTELP